MDTWSRPSKAQATPAPYYLTHPTTRDSHTCGRNNSSRKSSKPAPGPSASSTAASATPAKYCSARCRAQKPRVLDREIERAFVVLLSGGERWNGEKIAGEILEGRVGGGKGERRVLVPCGVVERLVFGRARDPEKRFGRRRNRRARGVREGAWRSVDMESGGEGEGGDGTWREEGSGDVLVRMESTGKGRASQEEEEADGETGRENGCVEREEEKDEDAVKRLEGQRAAEEKEQVKRAARRLCVFGYAEAQGDDQGKDAGGKEGHRFCEVIMDGKVVEPSFAKGDWGIRWRES